MQLVSHKSRLPDIERIDVQLKKLAQMIEDERYCLDIIVERKDIRRGLKHLQNGVLQDHIDHCLEKAAGDPSEKSRVTAEVMKLLEATAS
jgi:DNA-binding FrmR family transcriptional regulator